MKKSILLICGIFAGYSGQSVADNAINFGAGDTFEGCYSWAQSNPERWYVNASPTDRNCALYTAMCVYLEGRVTGVASCYTCNPGYELTKSTSGITACAPSETDITANDGGVGQYEYTYCRKYCTSSNCTSTAWTAKGTGYETRTYRACSTTGASGTCNTSTQYRCAAGYYGSSSNGTSGCSQCPTWTGVYTNSAKTTLARGTSSVGSTAITDCYIPVGTYYDATGTFKISGNCAYKN